MSSKFNFTDTVKNNPYLSEYFDEEEKQKNDSEYRGEDQSDSKTQGIDQNKSYKNKSQSKSKKAYKIFATCILSIALVASGLLIYDSNQSAKTNSQVLGTIETKTTDAISGDNFTLLINQRRPKEFVLERNYEDKLSLFEDKPNTRNSYLYKRNGMQSGMSIMSLEYDSRMDINTFSDAIKNKLGADYQVISKDITLPNGIKLAKISSPTQKDQSYYVSVTTGYYYIIVVYDQIRDQDTSSFVEKIIQGLYLNSN